MEKARAALPLGRFRQIRCLSRIGFRRGSDDACVVALGIAWRTHSCVPRRHSWRRPDIPFTVFAGVRTRHVENVRHIETSTDRASKWKKPEPRYLSGVFAKYVALVGSASEGALTTPAS